MKTKAEAIEALEESIKLKAEAERMMQELGITVLLTDADTLKKEVSNFCKAKGIEKLDLSNGRYGRMIQAVHERIWVGTNEDAPNDELGISVKPLKSLVSKEIWMKLTRRVPDPEKIEQAVSEGIVTLDEISPAYVEKMRAPFLRVFTGNGNGEA